MSMLGAPKLRPGSLRWFAAVLLVIALGAWLGCAFWWEASAVGPLGWVVLRSGCLRVEYGLREPLPPQLQVGTLLPWPPRGVHGLRFGRATEPRLRWWPDFTL